MMNLDRLCTRIEYGFSDISLLELALSHRSIGKKNNERLEFLGDSLLSLVISERLFEQFPYAQEGDLTRIRASLVKGETLAEVAREFDLGDYLYLGEGELKSGGFRRASILADAVEATIGAIYLDSGMGECRRCILSWFASRLNSLDPEKEGKDAKTRLQEYLQQRKEPLPEYSVVNVEGEAHAKEYIIQCSLVGRIEKAQAKSTNKRTAEKKAAAEVLVQLGI